VVEVVSRVVELSMTVLEVSPGVVETVSRVVELSVSVIELSLSVAEVGSLELVVVKLAALEAQPPKRTTRTRMVATSRLFFMLFTSWPTVALALTTYYRSGEQP
jgi:hypothetical protein